MLTRQHDAPRPSIDLAQVAESTRRALYDAVVEVHFSPLPQRSVQAAKDPDNHWVPYYSSDEVGLTMLYVFSRWFAVWRCLEEPAEAPEEVRWTVLRIGSDPEGGFGGLAFSEV